MTKKISLLLHTVIILYLNYECFVYSVSMDTKNVCPVEQESEELELQRHEQTVILHTTKPCWDVSQGFRCKVKTNGTKLSYKAIPKKKTIVIYKCCPGYFETPLETCEICADGYYGNNCSLHCNCTETEICNKVVGCCGSSNKQCSDLQSAAMKEFVENRNWMFPILLSSLLAVVLLSFGTFFYRRKYKKEKDPELPTLTYYPHVKELFTPNEVETREFNNPMYPGANERLSIKEIPDEPVLDAKRVELRNSTSTLNEYATLDYAALSSSDSLLQNQNSYEIPVHSSPIPDTRFNKNEVNEKMNCE